ncbi:uncharacterized protein A4U43_C10F980 [Asparagus officinalis]|uniref:GrpE protein homolog n=1 Tax=Asparagus officinalis TaxID=4686 RepID=A0A5P1E2Q9_ASPOF|nr:uncharacterized protein LOC109825994 isoform X2 [Asparagus officinalis]ONK55787.1 uncharacterized protein A4U43_C10F980 [Asparagus officinalis]
MISGRMRCGIPFFQRILRMAEAAQSLENPSAVKRQLLPPQTSQLARHSHLTLGAFQRYSSSSTSREPNDKESNQSQDSNNESTKTNNETAAPEQTEVADTEPDLSADDLVKVVAEKEEQLKLKHKEIEKMQDKVFRSYAEIENVLDRTKREAENTKKFSIQNFAKSLLDVADNLGRASSVVKDSFSKIDSSKDTVGAVPLLKTLLEGVEMTEKQLGEVFRKFGVEKFDPVNEQFDPNRHHAVFQIPDASKPPGSVAAVLKPGYMIYDRVLRPAEVGVTDATNE